jgi:transposase
MSFGLGAPHKKRSSDLDFETKAADVIGLSPDPPQHAVVIWIDEKTAIQALDRVGSRLPLSPGRAERHGFEYSRHGTLSLYAVLNPRTGEVVGRAVPRHTSDEFVTFLHLVVDSQPRIRELHIIVDKLSTHKSQKLRTFPVAHSAVNLHYTSYYSSWLNQVELWFSKMNRDVIALGTFTSITDLRPKLMRYIKGYNKVAKHFRRAYAGLSNRIAWLLYKSTVRSASASYGHRNV